MIIQYLLPLLIGLAQAQSIVLDKFGGINNAVDPAVIEQIQAQDCSNVELNKTGTGIKKRDGYQSYLSINNSPTAATKITSDFAFKNSNGNEVVMLLGGATVWASINTATPVQVTTVTSNTTMFCSDNQGTAYCFTYDHDTPFTYDGTTYQTKVTNSYPVGQFNAFTQDRHLVAGTTDYPNRLYISVSGSFSDFRGGNTLLDGWTEDLGNAGDKITAVKFLNGRVIVWKEYSIGGFNMTDQFNSVYYDIDNRIGVSNPEAIVVHNGIAYFKGSDNKFYAVDGSPGGIKEIGIQVSSISASLVTGKTRYDIETSQADFQAGNLLAAGAQSPLSATISPGSVVPSSVTLVDTSSADFAGGILTSSMSATDSIGNLTIASDSFKDNFADLNFTSSPTWTPDVSANWTASDGTLSRNTNTQGTIYATSYVSSGTWTATVALNAASRAFDWKFMSQAASLANGNGYDIALVSNGLGNAITPHVRVYPGGSDLCSGSNVAIGQHTYNITRTSSGTLTLYIDGSFSCTANDMTVVYTSYTHITMNGTAIWIDNIDAYGYRPQGYFTSRIFNTAFSTAIGGTFSVSSSTIYAANTNFQIRSSSSPNNDMWGSISAITNGGKISEVKEYWQYFSSFTTTIATVTPSIQDISLVAATTGQFITRCISIGSAITSFGSLLVDGTSDGGSFAFAASTGTSCTDPGLGVTWTTVSTGTTITLPIAPAFEVRTNFAINSATNTTRLDSITTNWVEGSTAPPSYGVYWNDGLYWAVASTSTNNIMLKYDVRFDQWFPFTLGDSANALLAFNNIFYFGSGTTNKLYKFSHINPSLAPTSDDGAAISAYWKSKDYSGSDPFVENQWDRISLIAKKETAGTLTSTWNINGGGTASGTYDVTLSTGDAQVRHNYSLPAGQRGTFLNIKFSNNSTRPFTVLGVKIDYKPFTWRPMP